MKNASTPEPNAKAMSRGGVAEKMIPEGRVTVNDKGPSPATGAKAPRPPELRKGNGPG